jgi:branched-chain amino acid transport system permease protein
VFIGLRWLMEGTRLGRLVRMVAEDPKLAQLAGVDVRRIYYGVFAFEGAAVAFCCGARRAARAHPHVDGL